MSDDFESLKKLGKKIHASPSSQMMSSWKQVSYQSKITSINKRNWWQLAAALLAGILIGKYLLQTNPEIFLMTSNNQINDETFEYVYTNN